MPTILFFISSGLFLGWSVGAKDAANVFGTAVGARMIRFTTAAMICSVFVIIGAVISGGGAAGTLGKLGSIHTMAGAFTVAMAAGVTLFFMAKWGIPVSTSQAIVGAIIGWNIFSHISTDYHVLTTIVSTWLICPLLAMIFSIIIFFIAKFCLANVRINILRLDSYTRFGLILAGAFGSYSLGANNIGNVMGVFVSTALFHDINLGSSVVITRVDQLFFLGGLAIAVGVFTYSKKVIHTVGTGIYQLSPMAALIAVFSSSLVLFLFASQDLHDWLIRYNLPAIPLVPVSSSQAIVGAIFGIGIAKGGRDLKFSTLGKIGIGWVVTPLMAALLSYVSLYFVQNVFLSKVN